MEDPDRHPRRPVAQRLVLGRFLAGEGDVTTMPDPVDAEALAEVLARHTTWRFGYSIIGGEKQPDQPRCVCGASFSAVDFTTLADAHRAHVAAELLALVRDAQAAAWSLGHAAGRDYQGDGWNSDAHDPEADNPYAARIEGR